MRTLAELQQGLQQHVLIGDEDILGALSGTEAVPATTRAAVYFNAYRSRLVEALASNMPRLHQLLGAHEFAQLAVPYIQRHPSRFTSVRWFGDRFAHSLEQSRPDQPWLAELAHWEWSLAAAFDAADRQPLGTQALAAVAPGEWAELRFEFHPSVQQVFLSTNAPAIYKALAEERTAPQPAALERPQSWLIWRQGLTPLYRSLETAEADALAVVRNGGTFAAMCEALCSCYEVDDVPAQAAGMLKRWLVEESVVALQRAQPTGPE